MKTNIPMNIGSPKTLDEAIFRIVSFPCEDLQEQAYAVLRDFIAQKFSRAYFQIAAWREGSVTTQPEDTVRRLFEDLTRRNHLDEDSKKHV